MVICEDCNHTKNVLNPLRQVKYNLILVVIRQVSQTERIHIMNPTTKLKRKGKSIVSGLYDLSDPVYNEGWMIHSVPKSIPSSKSARRKDVKS